MFEEADEKWVATLSKEASALANAEGGQIIIGVQEDRRGKIPVAGSPDGVPVGRVTRDQLVKKVEGNLFPYLPGIRVQPVVMDSLDGRVVYVLSVPKGSTAYLT